MKSEARNPKSKTISKSQNSKQIVNSLLFSILEFVSDFDIRNSNFKEGFTLLETLVALSVLIAALVGPVSLITRGILSSSFSKNKIIAANLAQEGLEFVRAIRDNNIICDHLRGSSSYPWNNDPTDIRPNGGSILNGKFAFDVDNPVHMTCFTSGGAPVASITVPRPTGGCDQPLSLDANGFYNYREGNPTIFSRCIVVCNPPGVVSPEECRAYVPDPAPVRAQDQMDVISIVKWNERGADHAITLHDRLYNWK